VEIRIKIPFPDDPAKRAMVVAIVCSILLHVALLASLITFKGLTTPAYLKRGEPLLVDLAPDKPEEKAPLGNPSRPVGPEPPPPKAPEPPAPPPKIAEPPPRPKMPDAPPRPKIAEAPPPKPSKAPPAPKVPPAPPEPARPEPPKQVAKAEPPPKMPAPLPNAPSPEPAPKAPEPQPVKPAEPPPSATPATPSPSPSQSADSPRPMVPPPAVPPGPSGERTGTQTALARPPAPPAPSMFRNAPGGGGGLRGGRGGVEGEPIPLDTPEPKYQDYFNKVREKIKANWIYPREAGDRGLQGELLLEFHIAKDGKVEYLELRHSSGAEILDRFAMNAVRLAQPFPPVPDDIAKNVLAINGLFRYQIIGASMLNQFLR